MRIDEYSSFASQLEQYSRALVQLKDMGIRISHGCRLKAYEKRLSQVTVDPRLAIGRQLVYAVTYDLREVDEINEIVTNLPPTLDPATLELLAKLASGSEHPDDELNASAREAQYELYLGTVFRQHGFPVEHGKPDLVVSWQNEKFFIEAKRPTSVKRFDDRLREAVHQSRALTRPGIIAISLDQIVHPANDLMTVPDFDGLALAVDGLIGRFVFEQAHSFRKRLPGEPVAALLLTARIPARIASTGHSSLGTSIQVQPLLDGTPEAHFAVQITKQMANTSRMSY